MNKVMEVVLSRGVSSMAEAVGVMWMLRGNAAIHQFIVDRSGLYRTRTGMVMVSDLSMEEMQSPGFTQRVMDNFMEYEIDRDGASLSIVAMQDRNGNDGLASIHFVYEGKSAIAIARVGRLLNVKRTTVVRGGSDEMPAICDAFAGRDSGDAVIGAIESWALDPLNRKESSRWKRI